MPYSGLLIYHDNHLYTLTSDCGKRMNGYRSLCGDDASDSVYIVNNHCLSLIFVHGIRQHECFQPPYLKATEGEYLCQAPSPPLPFPCLDAFRHARSSRPRIMSSLWSTYHILPRQAFHDHIDPASATLMSYMDMWTPLLIRAAFRCCPDPLTFSFHLILQSLP